MRSPLRDDDPSLKDAQAVALQFGVEPARGLSDEEAARRLAADGRNELRGRKSVPVWQGPRAVPGSVDLPAAAAVAISLVAWIVTGADGTPVDAIVIVAVVVLNAVLGFTQQAKAEDPVAALGTMTAAISTVLRSEELKTLPSAELVRGDVLVLGADDAVGADARLLTASALGGRKHP